MEDTRQIGNDGIVFRVVVLYTVIAGWCVINQWVESLLVYSLLVAHCSSDFLDISFKILKYLPSSSCTCIK